jgi:murein DD-endopeptidase MepM/ murein hydrolase activator NlpD
MDKVVKLKVGQDVALGALLGTVGKTGVKNSGSHLHYDMFACGPEALTSYRRLFGTPVGAFPLDELRIDDCIPIPSEPFIPVDVYDDDVVAKARANRVPLRGAR